eukprot:Plantae.Rhodophyta-Purpureofilum_apyrenoidigerum.ctg3582.p1 GENE.Plantae.Rhodophyta-Purpureofilum_apyrenoidigerum.ctg3582~~Plantae.Rhodophyta-Purpureofilum_apyrenoidigerum.ctg3582.p1  ORF type:complete len:323 (-),score=81.98 Plantae.Rhodophyta-Purpureofilum_apyrenoidigerum.ctg3582:1199-2143(-)
MAFVTGVGALEATGTRWRTCSATARDVVYGGFSRCQKRARIVMLADKGMGDRQQREEVVEYYRPKVDDLRLDDEKDKISTGEIRELPLFPLGIVLNPNGTVPLHIFEMRYRLLFNRIQDKDNTFGLIFYNRENNLVARVGCAAQVTKYNLLEDGRLLVINEGKRRFRVLRYVEEKPFIKAIVQFYDDEEPDEDLSEMEQSVWTMLQDVLRLSNKLYNGKQEFGEDMKTIAPGGPRSDSLPQIERQRLFSFSVNQVLDMTVQDQQLLLQTKSTAFRLKKQRGILDAARQYLAAQVTIKDALQQSGEDSRGSRDKK